LVRKILLYDCTMCLDYIYHYIYHYDGRKVTAG